MASSPFRRLFCRFLGHRYRNAGKVALPGWRPAVFVVCDRCGTMWRGVRPASVNRRRDVTNGAARGTT